jgi:predicted unusual protein kinase regulating ubiquinone biosynthesis (AarF/ABC1/UbiB family)
MPEMRPAEQTKGESAARARAAPAPESSPDDSSIEAALAESEEQLARACRPPVRTGRSLRAYWVTFVVIASYLSARLQARFRSEDAILRLLRRKHLANACRIERAIVHLQGLYIKVGQLISIMTNFLPSEFRDQLEGLQDQVPPRPYEDIERRFREEFGGRSPDELFHSFDRRPIASASIGQVHLAKLEGGQRVAVKVQYPDIEEIVQRDLRTLRRIFRIVQNFVPYQGLEDVYREIRAMLQSELDFRAEADNLERIARNFTGRKDVVFPPVVRALSTQRVLTTHFESGIKVGDLARIDRAGIDRAEVARKVVELYCQQIFSDGVYHADPHPGNLLVRRAQGGALSVVFLDFGAVAEVSPQMRQGLIELLQGALARDTPRIVRAMKQMGFIARGADDSVFDRVIEYFHDRFQEQISLDSLSLKDIKFDPQKGLENLADLRRMDISLRELSSNFHVPKEWILLERTLLLLMGLCTALDPQMNPMTVVRPYLERFVLGEEGDWQTFAVETAKDLFVSLTALPSDIHKFVASAKTGELSVRFHNLEKSTRLLYRLGHQAITAAIGITGAAIAIVLEGRGEIERAEWGWWTARIAAVVLVWSWWGARQHLRRR